MLDAMNAAGVPKGTIYTTGGWPGSHAFVELRASVFGEEIKVIGDMELTVCPFRKEGIITIEPVQEWVADYKLVFSASSNAPPSQ